MWNMPEMIPCRAQQKQGAEFSLVSGGDQALSESYLATIQQHHNQLLNSSTPAGPSLFHSDRIPAIVEFLWG